MGTGTYTAVGVVTTQTNLVLLSVIGTLWISVVYSINSLIYITTWTRATGAENPEVPTIPRATHP